MPIYEYKCSESACEHRFEKTLAFSQYKDPQACPECFHSPAIKMVSRTHIIFKGDGWVDKNIRIEKQMRKKNDRLDVKMEERRRDAPGLKLAPNVDGERVDSWSEARNLAASKGKNISGYETQIRKDKTLQAKPE